jgi:hypothetical protein
MSDEERRYDDREVGEILRKAMQAEPAKALQRGHGLSLTELKSIAAEVGIDPARVERAAHTLVQSHGSRTNPILGGPTHIELEARVPGEIGPSQTPEVLAVVRRATGHQGQVSEVHGTLEWSANTDMGNRLVTVSPGDGHSTIRAMARLGQGAALAFLPSAIGSLITIIVCLKTFADSGSPLALVLMPLIFALLYAIPRGLWARAAHKEADSFRRVVEEVGRLAESSAAESEAGRVREAGPPKPQHLPDPGASAPDGEG